MSAATQTVKKMATYWRSAGLTYLDQLNVASTALRTVLKEPARTEAMGKAQFRYREFSYPGGKESAPSAFRASQLPAQASTRSVAWTCSGLVRCCMQTGCCCCVSPLVASCQPCLESFVFLVVCSSFLCPIIAAEIVSDESMRKEK